MKKKSILFYITFISIFYVNIYYSQTYKLVWSDEFNLTQLDENVWSKETGGGGWGNEELQFYSARDTNAFIQDGKLIIRALEENFGGRNYTSARLITKDKKYFKFGKIEARIKLPFGKGIWPAFWLLGQNISTVGWPACGEIDIMEMIGGGNNDKIVYGTAHWDNSGQHASYGGNYSLTSGIFADDFHIFSIEWTPQTIKWFVDGFQYTIINITSSQLSEFQQNFFIILNIAVGGTWPGNPDVTTLFPQTMEVDYVRVYQDASNLPNISLTEPANNSEYNQFEEILLSANVDFGGNIEKVEFYQGETQIGETDIEPYQMIWRNVLSGNYQIKAIVKSVEGYVSESGIANVKVGNGAISSPYAGSAAIIPGKIEAEDYNIGGSELAYFDKTPSNTGQAYRNSEGVDIEVCLDNGGGFDIGWTESDEWASYKIDVQQSAIYDLTARIASPNTGGSFKIEIDSLTATQIIMVPNTGGWQNWESITVPIELTEGIHEFKFVVEVGNFNINRFEIYPPNSQPELKLISPNGGEIFKPGTIQEITWNQLKVDNVNLGLSNDGGSSWSFIIKDITSKFGSYRWLVPNISSSNCIIMIVDSKKSTINDMTDSKFTIDNATVIKNNPQFSNEFKLYQNYPNPFNPSTMIRYKLPESGIVILKLFDILGNQVKVLVDGFKNTGSYEYILDAGDLPNGVYFYTLQFDNFSQTKKLLLLK